MSVMDKLINAMKINPEEEYYDDDNFGDMDAPEAPAPTSLFRKKQEEPVYDESEGSGRSVSRGYNNNFRSSRRNNSGMEVCIIKPTSVEEARELTDTLLDGRTVVLNLEGLDVDVAQRIIDFTSGSCYAIRGNLMKIAHYIFVVTPENVDISGDISASMGLDDSAVTSSALDMPFAQ